MKISSHEFTTLNLFLLGANSPIHRAGSPIDYDSYRKYSIEQLPNLDLEMADYNFDADNLEKRLIETAVAHSTSPTQYQEDLKKLVGNYKMKAPKTEEIRNLERKYNVFRSFQNDTPASETITYARLAFMFPEYIRFDLLKFDSDEASRDQYCRDFSKVLPAIMKHAEFGGLIPTFAGDLDQSERSLMMRTLILYRCCTLTTYTKRDVKLVAAKLLRRIELSRLPNSLRIEFLQREDILSENKTFDAPYSLEINHWPQLLLETMDEFEWTRPDYKS